jgi:hypothetical protein
LVVKRWVGELPRGRAALYREAIRVLVRTWNVEGFAPLDEDETLAQLSYVACTMMTEGRQQIGQKALLKLLLNARRELEAELQFARISPGEFIERIEYRSSLLMQTGHECIDGVLQPVYEFRHLTFQEYLAARGYVEEQYPGRNSAQSLADLLELYFEEERWREVIPLAAVLAGRKAEGIIKKLTFTCVNRGSTTGRVKSEPQRILNILFRCVRDEVQVTIPTLKDAFHVLAKVDDGHNRYDGGTNAILRGKFGAIFQEIVEQSYFTGSDGFVEYGNALKLSALHLEFGDQEHIMSDSVAISLCKALEEGNRLEKIRAALVSMRLAFNLGDQIDQNPAIVDLRERFQLIICGLVRMLLADDLPSAHAAS